MKKIIKKYGNSTVIILDPEDLTIYDLKIGDVIKLEIKKDSKEEIKEDDMFGGIF